MDLYSVMDILNASMNLIDLKTVVNSVLGGLILLFLGGVGGFFVTNNKWKKAEEAKQREITEQEHKEKIRLTGTLLSEIKANQNQLRPFVDIYNKIMNGIESTVENDSLPNQLIISTNVYSDLAGKLGLLDDDNITKLIQYYLDIKYLEGEYKQLEIIHDDSDAYTSLSCLQLEESNQTTISIPGSKEILCFFESTNEVFITATELIEYLKTINVPSLLKKNDVQDSHFLQ